MESLFAEVHLIQGDGFFHKHFTCLKIVLLTDGFGHTGMTSESESEAESSPPVNYRESKIFFDVAPKESQPLFRHPTPTPKQLKVLKAQRTSYLAQENGATAIPSRPAPQPPMVCWQFQYL